MLIVDALQSDSQQFATTATRIRRKYWWQNIKVKFSLATGSDAFFSAPNAICQSKHMTCSTNTAVCYSL